MKKKNNNNKKNVSSSSSSSSSSQIVDSIFDVCIIGAGPAGLACLSAIREPYSLDHLTADEAERANISIVKGKHLHRPLTVCVIDPNATDSDTGGSGDSSGWMHYWKQNFDLLQIQHLRSPAMAHPNLFDKHALLAFASRQQQHHQHHHQHEHGGGRDNDKDNKEDKEDDKEHVLYESGCFDIKRLLGLGQTQVGLWKLPSTKLFNDFCDEMVRTLSHTLVTGHVADLSQQEQADGSFRIKVVNKKSHNHRQQYITARNVILAMGTVGKPIVPRGFNLGSPNVFCWNDPRAYTGIPAASQQIQKQQQRVLVVGGGLTAVQVALRVVKDDENARVVLCSRRPLMERHFDIPVEWFDSRSTNKCLADFYHYTIDERLQQLKETRDGGSIPPMYLKSLAEVCSNSGGRLTCWVGEVECIHQHQTDKEEKAEELTQQQEQTITVAHKGVEYVFDKVILSCGVSPQCQENPLVQNVLAKWPIETHGGLPAITQDLRWQKEGAGGASNIFVAGAMAALQVGPDAGNLMGIRRAAFLIANSLDCRCWLREKALANPFEALLWSDSDSSDDSDSDDTTETPAASDDDVDDARSCSICGDEVVVLDAAG